MYSLVIRTLFCLIVACEVNSMALKGSALTRYDPCGLGVIHFDKLTETIWQGVLNFHLYPSLLRADVVLSFENKVKLNGVTPTSSLFVSNDYHNIVIMLSQPLPKRYVFFLSTEEDDISKSNEPPTVQYFKLNNITLCDQTIKSKQTISSLNTTKDNIVNYQHICGRRSLSHTELVSVRTESEAGDWPWHVALFLKKAKDLSYNCGGNIISRTAVVTAGHCVYNKGVVNASKVVIVAGVNDRRHREQVGKQSLQALEIVLHPSYVDTDATADLAIVKVNKFQFTEYVQPICLWGPVYDKTALFGYQATIVGFGKTEKNKQSYKLRSAYTIIQNDSTCLEYSPMVYKPLLNEFSFCAGLGPDAGINPRNGDSGGGIYLTTMQPDHVVSWFLRGVLSKCGVSVGHTECDPEFYVVYTDIGPHYGWIYHHSGLKFSSNILS